VEFTREMINAAENLKILNEQGGFLGEDVEQLAGGEREDKGRV
jgi:hypothetical protein